MAIQLASWADLGYRLLGPMPAVGGGLSASDVESRVLQLGDYESISGQWIRRKARRKGVPLPESVEIVEVLDASSQLGDASLKFLDPGTSSEWNEYCDDLPKFQMESSDCVKLVNDFKTESDRPRALYFLLSAIAFAAPGHVKPLLRDHCLPEFFRQYKSGKVIGLRFDTRTDSATALMRSLYALAQAPHSELKGDSTKGVGALREWHMVSLPHLLPVVLDYFNYLFYPYVGGSRVMLSNVPGICLLFLFDPPEVHRPGKYPRNWLAVPSTSAGFADESFDVVDFAADYKGPLAERIGHHRFRHEKGFSGDDRLILFRWYLGRINRLLFELTDCANFTTALEKEAAIDPIFGYEHQITVDRLFRKTILAMSLDVAPLANLMSFEIADLYDTLSVRLKHSNWQAPKSCTTCYEGRLRVIPLHCWSGEVV